MNLEWRKPENSQQFNAEKLDVNKKKIASRKLNVIKIFKLIYNLSSEWRLKSEFCNINTLLQWDGNNKAKEYKLSYLFTIVVAYTVYENLFICDKPNYKFLKIR
jgi:hypothetical protein